MFTYTSPTHSFVQFPPDPDPSCAPLPRVCFPISLQTDVRFQVYVDTDEIAFLFARVVPSCTSTLPLMTENQVRNQFTRSDISVGESPTRSYVMSLNWLLQSDIDAIPCGGCCYIQLWKRVYASLLPNASYTDTLLDCSTCFERVCDTCHTSVIAYRGDENQFGFRYIHVVPPSTTNLLANYQNSIRLPVSLKAPQWPSTREVFVLSNGQRKRLSVRVEKQFTLHSDWLPKPWIERLVMALEHDTTAITNTNEGVVSQGFTLENAADVEYFIRPGYTYPLGQITDFKIKITPYNNYNSNC